MSSSPASTPPVTVAVRHGTVAELHALDLLAPPGAEAPAVEVWWLRPRQPALVVGSTQAALARRLEGRTGSVPVVRRRSGGGAVLVDPDATLWVDVVLRRAHPGWVDDVGRSADAVGAAWARALAAHGVVARTHAGPLQPGPWGRLACFAGVGPGEVLDATGAKLVGISQRRTRHAARLQCLVPLAPTHGRLVDLLGPALGPGEAPAVLAALAAGTGVVPGPVEPLLDALAAALR